MFELWAQKQLKTWQLLFPHSLKLCQHWNWNAKRRLEPGHLLCFLFLYQLVIVLRVHSANWLKSTTNYLSFYFDSNDYEWLQKAKHLLKAWLISERKWQIQLSHRSIRSNWNVMMMMVMMMSRTRKNSLISRNDSTHFPIVSFIADVREEHGPREKAAKCDRENECNTLNKLGDRSSGNS